MERLVYGCFLAILFFSGLGLWAMSFKNLMDAYFYTPAHWLFLVFGNALLMLIGIGALLAAIHLSREFFNR